MGVTIRKFFQSKKFRMHMREHSTTDTSSEQDHVTRALKYRHLAACLAIMCAKIDGQRLLESC